jgi:C-terminal processing protease CtpA/Prc
MVATVVGYLFDQPGLPLFDIVHRSDPPEHYATPSPGLADRNGDRPVYVLTAARTFPAGEGFAFLLQERHRAEVVGELTAGAANPGQPYRVNDLFDVIVPNGQVKSAVGGGNWERSGVKPDVAAGADVALTVAHVRMLRTLIDAAPQGAWRDRLQRELAMIETIR